MIIDTHCHYNLEPLDDGQNSWLDHWHMAQENDITHSMVVGTSIKTSRRAVEIAAADNHLQAAIGVHPSEYQGFIKNNEVDALPAHLEQEMQQLSQLCGSSKVAAIGETGLDYFRLPTDTNLQVHIKTAQQDAFISHLQLALTYQKPLIIHVRDTEVPESPTPGNAYWDVISILKQQPSLPRFILHCISGPIAYLQQALALGAHVGVAGNVTYKNADHIRSLVKLTPASQIVLETDAPFLPPQSHRGKPCEPWMIRLTAEFLEEELGLNREQLAANAQHLFPNFV
jgi:TatD DNase family protein